jgi:hypothetical protein
LAWSLTAALLAAANWARAEEMLADRRARIEALDPAQKQELLNHEEKFLKLEPSEQERLRRLSQELEQDPQGPELRRVMQRYYDWLKALPPYQRAELQELPPEERIKRVRAILADQSRKAGRGGAWGEFARREWRAGDFPGIMRRLPPRLDPADMDGLFTWMDGYVKSHTGEVLKKVPTVHLDQVKKELAQRTDPVGRQELMSWIWLWWQLDSHGKAPSITDKEWADLLSKLSPATRSKLEPLPRAAQWRAVSGLFVSFMLHQDAARHAGVPIRSVSEEELAQFFERELKPEDRERLLSLSGEDMQRALGRKYIEWKVRQLPPLGAGWDKRPGAGGPWPRPGVQDAPWQPGPSDFPSRGPRGRRPQQNPPDKQMTPDAAPTSRPAAERPPKKPNEEEKSGGPAAGDRKKAIPADASD